MGLHDERTREKEIASVNALQQLPPGRPLCTPAGDWYLPLNFERLNH